LTARLLGATKAVDEAAYRFMPDERAGYNRLADAAHISLGADRFDAAVAQGREQTFAWAVDEALSILGTALCASEPPTAALPG